MTSKRYRNVGCIEWDRVRLAEFIQFKNGKKRPVGSGDIPVYGGNGILDFCDKSNNHNIVIIGRVGAYCGSVYYEKDACWVSDNAISANNKLNSDICFIYYLMKNLNLNSRHIGTSQPLLTQEILNNIEFYLPPISEQKAIAAALSCLDDKIELNNRINKNLEAQAQAIFNEWFFRKDTQNNWGVLGDIADINPSRKLSKGTVARYIEMSNLASTTAFPLGWEEKSYSGGAKFQNGDTLLARITPCLENGKGAYINFLQEGEIAFGSTEYIVITGKKGYCNEFFYFLIRYLDFQLYAAKSMTGSSGRQRVSADSIASYKMPIPSLELCEKFHEIAEQVMTSNCNRSLENRTLSTLRDTLLPKLMSGEIQILQEV